MKTTRKILPIILVICFSHFAKAQIGNSLDVNLGKFHSGKMSIIPGFTGYYGYTIGTEDKLFWRLGGSMGFGGKSTPDESYQCFSWSTYDVAEFTVTYRYFFYQASLEMGGFITGNGVDGGLYGRGGLGYRMISTGIRYNDYPDGYSDTLNLGGNNSSYNEGKFSSANDDISGLVVNLALGYEFPALDYGNLFAEFGTSLPMGKNTDFGSVNPPTFAFRFGVKWILNP